MRLIATRDKDLSFQLMKLLNNGLTLTDNMSGALLEVITTGENQALQHGLGRIPDGFIVLQIIQEEEFSPISTANIQVQKQSNNFLYFIPAEVIERTDVSFWSVELEQWTRELLYFRASVANLKVRLFVL